MPQYLIHVGRQPIMKDGVEILHTAAMVRHNDLPSVAQRLELALCCAAVHHLKDEAWVRHCGHVSCQFLYV